VSDFGLFEKGLNLLLFLVKSRVMDTWERLAKGVKKELANTHRLDLQKENKIARFIRKAYFTGRSKRGPLPFPSYEGNEEILIDGNKKKVMVKKLGLGYYNLTVAVEKRFHKLRIRPLFNEDREKIGYDGIEYYWK